jgi:hypothetical protein
MSKISTYSLADSPLQLSDRLIGTEAPRPIPSITPLATKNFSLGELLQLFSSNFPAATLQAVLDAGNIATQNINLTGTINVTLIKPTNIEDMLGSQGTTFQILSKAIGGFNWVDPPVSITLTTTGSSGPSTLIGGVLNIPVYTGGIGTIPNLQQVTDKGATTTNDITVSKATGTSFFQAIAGGNSLTLQVNDVNGTYIELNDPNANRYGYIYGAGFSFEEFGYSAIDLRDGFLSISNVALKPYIYLSGTDGTLTGSVTIKTDLIDGIYEQQLPDKSGTFAMLDDIPSGGGTVTSVDLSMPSAFTVTNNPVTTSGTLTVTGAGLISQYVRGDGTLANFPNSTGGGSSVNYYLNGSISQGTFGGTTYYQMSKTPVLGAGTNFTRTNGSGNGYIASFITDVADPSQLNIPGGNWNVEFYFNASSGGGSPSFYAELYKVSATNVFTLIASDSLNPEGITNGTTVDQYFTSIPVPQTTLLATDRLAIRIFVNTGGRTITLHTENSNLSEVLTTFTTGLTALNGLTAQVQNFAVGTSGTDFAISSVTETHTFNLPTASATNRGALSSADWSTFNNKQDNLKTFNTTQGIYYFDDFMGNLSANFTNTFGGFINNVGNGQGTTRSTSTINNRTNQQGVLESLTSANATGTAGYYYAGGVYKGSGAISIETYINYTTLSVLGERFFSLFGFYTGANFTNPANCIIITYDEGGVVIPNAGGTPNFRCVTKGGSTVTNTVTSVPVVALQWYRLKINISNDGNTVTFFIDNTLVATHTTNIPLNATFLPIGNLLQKTSGVSARAMQSDYFMYEQIFTNPR